MRSEIGEPNSNTARLRRGERKTDKSDAAERAHMCSFPTAVAADPPLESLAPHEHPAQLPSSCIARVPPLWSAASFPPPDRPQAPHEKHPPTQTRVRLSKLVGQSVAFGSGRTKQGGNRGTTRVMFSSTATPV